MLVLVGLVMFSMFVVIGVFVVFAMSAGGVEVARLAEKSFHVDEQCAVVRGAGGLEDADNLAGLMFVPFVGADVVGRGERAAYFQAHLPGRRGAGDRLEEILALEVLAFSEAVFLLVRQLDLVEQVRYGGDDGETVADVAEADWNGELDDPFGAATSPLMSLL